MYKRPNLHPIFSLAEGEGNVLIDLLKQVSNVATFRLTMTYDGARTLLVCIA